MRLAAFLLIAAAAAPGPPAHLETQLQRSLGFSAEEIAGAGKQPVVRELDKESGARTLSVAGVVWIPASPGQIAERLGRDRGLVKHAALLQSGTFSDPAVPGDVASYHLPKGDLELLEECEVGDCKFKMQKIGIEAFGRIDWSAPDADEQADAFARERMVAYVNAYRREGASALGVYADKEQPLSLAAGLRDLLAEATYMERHVSELDRHLERFPAAKTPGTEDLIHWSVQDYGYRPVTDLTHTVVYQPPDPGAEGPAVVAAQKHIFTSHYFHARVELIGLFPAEGSGTYLVYVDRSLFDGEVGGFKRHLLVKGCLNDVRERLAALRERFAAPG